ncbi:efflux RND transporter periplasmic adaptor subunit [Paenibacillus sp. GM2]|uniref:efflux RND transporter periplasmic adaptor subunit n=1 Tax=Paenibacillus sp. GM2 TaxID=1622070 RepID=UPI0008385B99|nr:efflux RND transporter periplasmic adaptor subunit [Paenibacillus sp. GM2]
MEMKLRQRRMTRYLFIVFLFVLAALTLFSNTFQTMMLPKVTTEQPVKKQLSHVIQGTGTIDFYKKEELINESGWKIEDVVVNENDIVKKGQILVTFDGSSIESQLLDEKDRLDQLKLDEEMMKEQLKLTLRDDNEEAVQKAKRELEKLQLNIKMQQRKIDQLREDLAEKIQLTAPYDGRIVDLDAKDGMNVPQGGKVLTLAKTDEGMSFSFVTDSNSAALLQIGETLSVHVKGEKDKTVDGTIAEITEGGFKGDAGQGGISAGNDTGTDQNLQRTISVSIKDSSLKGGEQAEVYLDKPAKRQGMVIRKGLVKEDSSGSYVFVIRENKSPLGNTYLAQKAYLQLGEESNDEIVVLSGLSPDGRIIAETSEPLQDGNRVRLN